MDGVLAVAQSGRTKLLPAIYTAAAGFAFAFLILGREDGGARDVVFLLPAIAGAAAAARSDLRIFEVHEWSAALIALSGLLITVASPNPESHLLAAGSLVAAFGIPHVVAVLTGRVPWFPYGDLVLAPALGLTLTIGQFFVFGAVLFGGGAVFLAARSMRLFPFGGASPALALESGGLQSPGAADDPDAKLIPFAPILIAAAIIAQLLPPMFVWADI